VVVAVAVASVVVAVVEDLENHTMRVLQVLIQHLL
jgi:hypothetical protein